MYTYTKYHLDVPGLKEPGAYEKQRLWEDAGKVATQEEGPHSQQWWYENVHLKDWKEKRLTRLVGVKYTFTRDEGVA